MNRTIDYCLQIPGAEKYLEEAYFSLRCPQYSSVMVLNLFVFIYYRIFLLCGVRKMVYLGALLVNRVNPNDCSA